MGWLHFCYLAGGPRLAFNVSVHACLRPSYSSVTHRAANQPPSVLAGAHCVDVRLPAACFLVSSFSSVIDRAGPRGASGRGAEQPSVTVGSRCRITPVCRPTSSFITGPQHCGPSRQGRPRQLAGSGSRSQLTRPESTRGTDRAKLSASRGKSRLFSRFSSVSRVH